MQKHLCKLVMSNQPVVDKQKKEATAIDIAVPSDCNIRKKEEEERSHRNSNSCTQDTQLKGTLVEDPSLEE